MTISATATGTHRYQVVGSVGDGGDTVARYVSRRAEAIELAREYALLAPGTVSLYDTRTEAVVDWEPTEARNAANDVHTGAVVAAERESSKAAEVASVTGHSTPTVAILTALDALVSKARTLHPDIPVALALTLGNGHGKKHGHFAADAWRDSNGENVTNARHEIELATDSFSRGAEPTATTVLHELAHAAAFARGIKDTSRGGRYHSDKFEKVASEFGCVTYKRDDSFGWGTNGLMESAKVEYAEELANLAIALTSWRVTDADKPKAPKTTLRIECGCAVPVTVPIKWWETMQDVLSCTLCEDEGNDNRFHPVED